MNIIKRNRCFWVNENNLSYVDYHDNIWCKPKHNDVDIFECLILEIFQSGLSFEIVYNKIENFKIAFDNYNLDKIVKYTDDKLNNLYNDKSIIRNRKKIDSVILNAKVFQKIQIEFLSFNNYIWKFTNGKTIYDDKNKKDKITKIIFNDLKNRGMKFLGIKSICSFLEAIGIFYSHEVNCFLYKNK